MKHKWLAFAVLGWIGLRIYQQAPPVPFTVTTPDGQALLTRDDIQTGQNVWQSMGGMGLTLFSLRALKPGRIWNVGTIRFAFWAINIGLMAVINRFRWLRVVGDTIFAAGCVSFVWFVLGLSTGHSYEKR